MSVERDVRIVAGVAVQSHRPADADVVAVVRAGVEHVVQPTMAMDRTWGTFAATAADTLGSGRSNTGRNRLDWTFVDAKQREGTLEAVTAGAQSTAMKEAFDANPDFDLYDPHVDVAGVAAGFPMQVPYRDEPIGGVTVVVQMSTWALSGGGESLQDVTAALTGWILQSAEALDADSGYLALGYLREEPTMASPYEVWAGTHPADRDVTRDAWGYGWGTLLSARHVEAIGGLSRLQAVGTVSTVGGGRTWVTWGLIRPPWTAMSWPSSGPCSNRCCQRPQWTRRRAQTRTGISRADLDVVPARLWADQPPMATCVREAVSSHSPTGHRADIPVGRHGCFVRDMDHAEAVPAAVSSQVVDLVESGLTVRDAHGALGIADRA